MMVVQTKLTKPTPTGTAHLIAWLPVDPRVKPGSVISLDKDEDNRWKVEAQFATQDSDLINTKWGLELPKSQRTER
jgi:hypothetical protein